MKPIYTFDFQFDADHRLSSDIGHISLGSFISWAKEEDEDYEKGFLKFYKPKTRIQKLVEKWDNFVYKLLNI